MAKKPKPKAPTDGGLNGGKFHNPVDGIVITKQAPPPAAPVTRA